MLLARCACHRIADICNTFPVCCRAKSESIHIHCICDSSQSNRHHHGCRTNRLHCNRPNGVVSSKSTKDLIAFSLQVSFPLQVEKFNSTETFFFHFGSTDIHVIPIATRQFIYEIGQLRLRGDVIIRCYQLTTNERTLNAQHLHTSKTLTRELIFSTQFHTCAITDRDITFYRSDLDYACEGEC